VRGFACSFGLGSGVSSFGHAQGEASEVISFRVSYTMLID